MFNNPILCPDLVITSKTKSGLYQFIGPEMLHSACLCLCCGNWTTLGRDPADIGLLEEAPMQTLHE